VPIGSRKYVIPHSSLSLALSSDQCVHAVGPSHQFTHLSSSARGSVSLELPTCDFGAQSQERSRGIKPTADIEIGGAPQIRASRRESAITAPWTFTAGPRHRRRTNLSPGYRYARPVNICSLLRGLSQGLSGLVCIPPPYGCRGAPIIVLCML
jgi:hypothetical protein